MLRILAVDDDITVMRTLERLLRSRGHAVDTAGSGEAALSTVRAIRPDLVLLDVQMPGIDGLETLERLGREAPSVPVIIMTGMNDVDTAVRAFKRGAVDFVSKPFDEAKLFGAIDAIAETRRDEPRSAAPLLVGQSPRFREAIDLAIRFARPEINVLLEGETGTGKELFARMIHGASKRHKGPFVAVDCSMLAESLIESELFGHEKGAFTGAVATRIGQFERADGGTLFLDEAGNLSYTVQAKLLRVLQERTFERVGGREAQKLDIRLISAANVDLLDATRRGVFRVDLYHRLAEVTLSLPPLRERRGDVSSLCERFVARYAARFEAKVRGVSAEALARLDAYPWPGNVRELENVIKAAVVLAKEAGVVRPEHLPAWIGAAGGPGAGSSGEAVQISPRRGAGKRFHVEFDLDTPGDDIDLKAVANAAIEAAERVVIEDLVRQRRHSQTQLAKLLNVDPKTLRTKLRKYGLDGD
jgi:DNA-binding NtrC family response regulator